MPVKPYYNKVKTFWTREKTFTFLLVVLAIYIFIIIPLLNESIFSKIVFLFFYYLLLASSMPYLLKRKENITALCLIVIPFLLLIIEIYLNARWFEVFTDLFIGIYCSLLARIILLRAFDQGRINIRRIQGAVIVYLLVAIIFCLIYHSIFILNNLKGFNGLTGSHRKEFLYFSLSTLTTDGYGDITAVNTFARSVSNLEALIGQLYPAILIARLLSMEFSSNKA